jgi:CRISPR-associated protein (TIGR02584 family)
LITIMTRKILLAATGMTPQIVTETLYALAIDRGWIPTEIHVITTQSGAESVRLNLLTAKAGEQGRFYRLLADYGLPDIAFPEQNIHVLADHQGKPLDDIRTQEENRWAADFITNQVRELARDTESEIHASLAGGRKTMGYFLGYALSLFGRPQDRLSHVLVNAPYETNRDFYYPTPYSFPIDPLNGKGMTVDAKNARIDLAEIPFVRLADGLPKRLMEMPCDFSRIVDIANREPSLKIDTHGHRVWLHGEGIHLEFSEFVLLLWYAECKMAEKELDLNDWESIEDDFFGAFPQDLCRRGIIDAMQKDDLLEKYETKIDTITRDKKSIAQWIKERFRPLNTGMRKRAEAVLPERLVAVYFRKTKGNGDFLVLDAGRITILGNGAPVRDDVT